MDRDDPGRSRGFGFVTYQNPEVASAAVAAADGQDLEVRFAPPPRLPPPVPLAPLRAR